MDDLVDDAYLSDLPLWSDEAAMQTLCDACEKHQVPVDVVTELVIVQRERQHQEKARNIYARFEEILGRVEEN